MFQGSEAAGARHRLVSSLGYSEVESTLAAIAILLNGHLHLLRHLEVSGEQRQYYCMKT